MSDAHMAWSIHDHRNECGIMVLEYQTNLCTRPPTSINTSAYMPSCIRKVSDNPSYMSKYVYSNLYDGSWHSPDKSQCWDFDLHDVSHKSITMHRSE